MTGIGRPQQHASELLGYLKRNDNALVHYPASDNRFCRRLNEQTTLAGCQPTSSMVVTCRQPNGDYTTVQQTDA